jgi:SAM-dependent methyltransferase/ectoine hydroxylase-related dioxygenase (phytanoyl-CoA dioxygenase family)
MFFRKDPKVKPESDEQLKFWEANGYLVLPQAVDPAICDAISREVERHTGSERRSIGSQLAVDVLDGPFAGRLIRAADAPDEAFTRTFKLNNLFVDSDPVRRGMYHPTVVDALTKVLGDAPVAINSLNFVRGSQQPPHIDSWYMPPPRDYSLAVASLCLEDVDLQAGPLFYYPGSHLIPPYRFSHGGLKSIDAEMPACTAYVDREIVKRGLRRETFAGRKGDVFLWHCQLLHGGTQINDPARTRRSLVVHYWGKETVKPEDLGAFAPGNYYLKRNYYFMDNTTPPPAAAAAPAAPATPAAPAPAPVAVADTASPHIAFETWEGKDESLESVEMRIHDGVPRELLHDRASGYLNAFEIFFPNTKPQTGCSMMEIGSGTGYIMQAALKRYSPKRLIGLDVAAGMIEHARARFARDGISDPAIEFRHYDGYDMPFETGSLDHVYSVAALQHAPRPYCLRAMLEAHRVVRPGGRVWIHLLAYSHFREHVTPAGFAAELHQQIRGLEGHWHHYYSVDELDSIARYGIGASDIEIREHMGSIFLSYSRS